MLAIRFAVVRASDLKAEVYEMEISFCLLPWVGFIVLSLFLIKAHFEFNHHWTMCRKEIEEGRKKEKGRRKGRNLER